MNHKLFSVTFLTLSIAFLFDGNGKQAYAQPTKSLETPLRQGPKLLSPGEHGVGRFISDFSFTDIEGVSRSLHGEPQHELTVIAFTSTSCPLSKKYLPTLVELHREYAQRGVRFILVNSVATDKVSDMQSAANRFGSNVEYNFDKGPRSPPTCQQPLRPMPL